jgi:hypothetical protein
VLQFGKVHGARGGAGRRVFCPSTRFCYHYIMRIGTPTSRSHTRPSLGIHADTRPRQQQESFHPPPIQTLLTALSGCVCSQQNTRPQSHAQCDFRIARWPEERRVDRTEQEASASTKRAMAVRSSCLVVTEQPVTCLAICRCRCNL